MQSIELNGTKAQVYDARASSYVAMGRMKDALRDVKEVVRLMPDSYRVRSLLSELLESVTCCGRDHGSNTDTECAGFNVVVF